MEIQLAESIVAWWERAQFLVSGANGEYNVFDSEPDFVAKAKVLLSQGQEGAADTASSKFSQEAVARRVVDGFMSEVKITSIETHKTYPFVQFGLAHDFDPSSHLDNDHVVDPGDWWLKIDGVVQGLIYSSKPEVLENVENEIFGEWNSESIARHIEHYKTIDVALALRLAILSGRASGVREAKAEFAMLRKNVESIMDEHERVLAGKKYRPLFKLQA